MLSICCKIGNKKAVVFPVPVCDCHTIFVPVIAASQTSVCICVGVVYPSLSITFWICRLRLKGVNPVGSGCTYGVVNSSLLILGSLSSNLLGDLLSLPKVLAHLGLSELLSNDLGLSALLSNDLGLAGFLPAKSFFSSCCIKKLLI